MRIKKPKMGKVKAAIKPIKAIGVGRGGGSIKMPKMAAMKTPSLGGGMGGGRKRKRDML